MYVCMYVHTYVCVGRQAGIVVDTKILCNSKKGTSNLLGLETQSATNRN
jgi:hypothetical protein